MHDLIEENRRVIDRVYRAFLSGDLPTIVGAFAPQGTLGFAGASPDVPWHVPARNREELPTFFRTFAEHVDVERFDRTESAVTETTVVERIALRYRVKRTGRVVQEEQVHWWTLRDGLVTAMTHFEDTARVVAATAEAFVRDPAGFGPEVKTEIVRYELAPADVEPFFEAYTKALGIVEASGFALGVELLQKDVDGTRVTVVIRWRSASDHLKGFRQSPQFRAFFALVEPYYRSIVEMEHYSSR